MRNSAAAGRRLARDIVLRQLSVTAVLALFGLAFGVTTALGVAVSGTAVALGTALMAWRSFAGVAVAPGVALFRLIVGTLMKWLVILSALYGALAVAQLPPLAVIAGLVAALLSALWEFRTST